MGKPFWPMISGGSGLPNPITPPVARNSQYDGQYHDLCTAGSVASGRFKYRIDDGSGIVFWETQPPSESQTGTYTVLWKVENWDSSYRAPNPQSGTLTARITTDEPV